MKFSIGKQVMHKYTREPLWILREGNQQILCRTKDLREIWFYPEELEEIDSIKESIRNSRFL